jgi:hypothetical protein
MWSSFPAIAIAILPGQGGGRWAAEMAFVPPWMSPERPRVPEASARLPSLCHEARGVNRVTAWVPWSFVPQTQ